MHNNLSYYSSIFFDCDGVLLDSNRVKTEAFRIIASRFGDKAADELAKFHVCNGGISRYQKFEYLFKEILGEPVEKATIQQLADEYGKLVYEHLLNCPVASGLEHIRKTTAQATWFIVSGGAESELRSVFKERGLAELFDGGIYGNPSNKDEILTNLTASGAVRKPAIFLGDSRYDHQVATRAGFDFVFVHGWTEFTTWKDYCTDENIVFIEHIEALAI
ncbi:HAD family hydrolase [Azotobacter chroococcum]|uniref:HAD family hydrolase n=1 Tax=Azotobacter chroococcum TaxID=353 RepID=UPI0010AE9901|nr:HAD hydrolase-like protein [Azotobacter chroococcum]TKD44166.1 HAD family hydrolase [Azotobacter chroococcum]